MFKDLVGSTPRSCSVTRPGRGQTGERQGEGDGRETVGRDGRETMRGGGDGRETGRGRGETGERQGGRGETGERQGGREETGERRGEEGGDGRETETGRVRAMR